MASTPYSNINLPQNVTDPLYTSSQASLDKVGSGLLTGDVPDYYKSIGDFDSPQFQAMLNSVKGQVMQGSQEASAINGTGRSGVGVTASNNALNSILPQLSYQDYTRAVAGRGALLDTGINTEQGVRASAQNQQQFDSNFNQTLFGDQVNLASLIDNYKKQASQAQGAFYGNVGTALFGQDVGSLVSGGMDSSNGVSANANYNSNSNGMIGNNLSQLFSSLGSINSSSIPNGGNSLTSSLGSFGPNSLSSYGGTSSIDALIQSGAPLALAG